MTVRPTLALPLVDPRQLKPARQVAQPLPPPNDPARMRVTAGASFGLPALGQVAPLRIHRQPANPGSKPAALVIHPAPRRPKDIEVGGGFVIRPQPSIGERASELRRASGHSPESAGSKLASAAPRFTADGEPWRGHTARLHASAFGGKQGVPTFNTRAKVFEGNMVEILGPGFTHVHAKYLCIAKVAGRDKEFEITVSSRNKTDQRSLARLGKEDASVSTISDTIGRETAELSAIPKYYRIPFSDITVYPSEFGARKL